MIVIIFLFLLVYDSFLVTLAVVGGVTIVFFPSDTFALTHGHLKLNLLV